MTTYQGSELELFAEARQWKKYWSSRLAPWIFGDVLDVGAGSGGSIELLQTPRVTSWTALEPDPKLAALITQDKLSCPLRVHVGTLADIEQTFDTILYIDVLEHIEHDHTELMAAAEKLSDLGSLIVLSPAHPFLFSEFDAAIGHYRRYSKEGLLALQPPGVQLQRCEYIDSVGMLASLGNRLFLKTSQPSISQIRFWDRVMVPCSRILDPLIAHRIGKTVIAIWQKI